MPDAAQYTLGLFDSTTLAGFAADPAEGPDDLPVDPAPGALPASPETEAARFEPDAESQNTGAAFAAWGRGTHFALDGDRVLARGWPARARDNIAAIALSKAIEEAGGTPTRDEQERMLRFIGFGASDLAQTCFPLPGAAGFRPGWDQIGQTLADTVTPAEYAALQRATQYAHYTPEPIIRALWRAAQRLGFAGGRILEPGMGTGLFFALMPEALRQTSRLTGVEYDPVTARIARLIHPQARVRREDYTRSKLGGGFDLAIGNPPFADRVVRGDPDRAALGLRLHDYFIARSIARLRPGGIALFVTSTGTMDKASTRAREHIAGLADLIGAVRLPESSMKATAGTDVVIDILVFQRRAVGQAQAGEAWLDVREFQLDRSEPAPPDDETTGAQPNDDPSFPDALPERDAQTEPDAQTEIATASAYGAPRQLRRGTVEINEYFVTHPEMVLGRHAQRRGIYGPGLAYTCLPRDGAPPLETLLDTALARLPRDIVPPAAELPSEDDDPDDSLAIGTAADGATIKEGSFLIAKVGRLCQIIDGAVVPVAIKQGRSDEGLTAKAARIIRALLPIRDAVREVLRAQASGRCWREAQIRLRCAYSTFIRYHGPINHTVIATSTDAETGEEREQHRRPNLAPFADDPDCWLVASIEDYDADTGVARMGPVFRDRVLAPPAAPVILSASDALAVTLNETGRVDPDRLGELLDCDPAEALRQLGATVYLNPETASWETRDAYLSGAVRYKLFKAVTAAATDPACQRNVDALREAQPRDIPPSDISARLGAPWIPADVIQAFVEDVMGAAIEIFHTEAIACWSLLGTDFIGTAAGTSEWGTPRRHAGALLHDALNGATPQIFDTLIENGAERRVLNPEATEAAKEKLGKIKTAFIDWVWTDSTRADRLARIYNQHFNDLVPRKFDGQHLTLPGASTILRPHPHQKNVIWRIVATGSAYIAHAVGAGKTFSIVAAVMEQKRLGLIAKAMITVPNHCLAQMAREFLQLYPNARILVADETNFTRDKRARFLARAATAVWDAIIIPHSAFRFIAVPARFEESIITEQIRHYEALKESTDEGDRVTRKRLEGLKERLGDRLEALRGRHDDMVTIEEIGIDQLIVDEAQEFRKLSFATNRINLKGVDPEGSQRAWDLWVKARFIDSKNPRRALIQASGTPITNTLGEMFTLLRFQNEAMLRQRGIHEFDAWAAAFGDTRTELELQPSGLYKPVERFSQFINVPELVDLFRGIADVVLKDDLRASIRLPRIKGGQRQLITAPASESFRAYQRVLAERIDRIEERIRKVQPGDDIILAVITDGRHAAIDMRLVDPGNDNEPDNKLNRLIANTHRVWTETASDTFRRPDGAPYPTPGGGQLIFSDLGTIAVEAKRGFSAYRWIKQELVRLGIPASEIVYAQDFKRAADKQRAFNEFNAGRIRVMIGSSEKLGTGANVQTRLKAEHHLDVPWLPSQIEQREGRAERQGNQYDEIEIYAYATLGSTDATMWQNNERKARFIAAALSGDRAIRTIDDIGEAANQFALAKAIASGDARLMQKAGLESEIARLGRQRAAHFDDQLNIRRQVEWARSRHDCATRRIVGLRADLERRIDTRGDLFAMEWGERRITDRRVAGELLLSKLRLTQRARTKDDIVLGGIGGFEMVCGVQRGTGHEPETKLVLKLAEDLDFDHGPGTTPLGLISRLEHALARLERDLADQTLKARDAALQLRDYEGRLGRAFPLQAELDAKLAQLADLNVDLADTGRKAA